MGGSGRSCCAGSSSSTTTPHERHLTHAACYGAVKSLHARRAESGGHVGIRTPDLHRVMVETAWFAVCCGDVAAGQRGGEGVRCAAAVTARYTTVERAGRWAAAPPRPLTRLARLPPDTRIVPRTQEAPRPKPGRCLDASARYDRSRRWRSRSTLAAWSQSRWATIGSVALRRRRRRCNQSITVATLSDASGSG